MRELTIGSLFAGIGGFELGLEAAGLGPTRWQVELDPWCRGVLADHWPDAERFADVRMVGAHCLAPVSVICGGFPCQDISAAGKGAGLAGARSGLWREFARVVGELLPRWVVVENVASGATKWVDAVVRGLVELGYEGIPIPLAACDVGAPQKRERVFVVARHVADADGDRLEALGMGRETPRRASRGRLDHTPHGHEPHGCRMSRAWPPKPGDLVAWSGYGGPRPAIRRDAHGLFAGLFYTEWCAQLCALGNAVVPQCAEAIGEVILELEAEDTW